MQENHFEVSDCSYNQSWNITFLLLFRLLSTQPYSICMLDKLN